MHIIAGKFKCKAGAKDDLVKLVADLMAPSRQEEGCIQYSFYEDQFAPNTFLFYEEWRSRDDIEAHFSKPYFTSFMQGLSNLIDGQPNIKIFDISTVEEL